MFPHPSSNAFGGSRYGSGRQSSREPGFQPTMLPGRGASSGAQSASGTSVRNNPSLGTSIRNNPLVGTSARDNPPELQPGEPHMCDIRSNRAAGRLEYTVCRCQNPHGHAHAYTWGNVYLFRDINGIIVNWPTMMKRILDRVGKNTVSRQESLSQYPALMCPRDLPYFLGREERFDEDVVTGENSFEAEARECHTNGRQANAMSPERVQALLDSYRHPSELLDNFYAASGVPLARYGSDPPPGSYGCHGFSRWY